MKDVLRAIKRAGARSLRSKLLGGRVPERRWSELLETGQVEMGAYSYGVPDVITYRGNSSRLVIGKYVSIAAEVQVVLGGNHRVDWVSTYPFRVRHGLPGAFEDGHPATKGDVRIGSDVWIARGARLLSGIEIGDGAVIGAYAVVTRSVRAYSIVAGNPAREVRRRFPDDQVEALQRIAWWDWPHATILERVQNLSSSDVPAFIAQYGSSQG